MSDILRRGYSGIGGQAVLEGVMMQNGEKYAVAVRKPDGNVVVEVEHYHSLSGDGVLKKIPFVRGIFNFVDSLALGMRALNYSATFYDDEAEKAARKDSKKIKSDSSSKGNSIWVVFISVILAIGLFVVMPTYVASLFEKFLLNPSLTAIIEGAIRIIVFLAYIILISLLKDIRRLYQYHGAEHKCINCIERGKPLTVSNVMSSSRFHHRCGTSFIFFVVFISVVLFFFIRIDNLYYRILLRLLMVPVIAGVAYEILRLAGRNKNLFVTIISAPGVWLQHITTKEPDKHMVQVAIASVEAVFDWKAYLGYYYDYEITDNMVFDDDEEDHIKLNFEEDDDEFTSLRKSYENTTEEDDWEDEPIFEDPDENDWESLEDESEKEAEKEIEEGTEKEAEKKTEKKTEKESKKEPKKSVEKKKSRKGKK